MTIKKILIVPAEFIVEKEPQSPYAAFFMKGAKYIKRKLFGMSALYNVEVQFYGDIPKILGAENTYVMGEFFPYFHSFNVPESCPYPSCHGLPRGTVVHARNLAETMKNVDAVLVSTRAGERGREAIRAAKKRDIPVAIIDGHDHKTIYSAPDIPKELCRGFRPQEDFDLYFKKNLPLGHRTDTVLPLAPLPLRPEMYHFRILPKTINIFHSGKERPGIQPDGKEVVRLLQEKFTDVHVVAHATRGRFLTLREYWDYLSQSRFALSPSRLTWDSFRHGEAGLAPETALITPKPYVETVGPHLADGVNAVLYDTAFRDGGYHMANPTELTEKVRFYLEHDAERIRLARRWHEDVMAGHTIFARSRYILDMLGRL